MWILSGTFSHCVYVAIRRNNMRGRRSFQRAGERLSSGAHPENPRSVRRGEGPVMQPWWEGWLPLRGRWLRYAVRFTVLTLGLGALLCIPGASDTPPIHVLPRAAAAVCVFVGIGMLGARPEHPDL